MMRAKSTLDWSQSNNISCIHIMLTVSTYQISGNTLFSYFAVGYTKRWSYNFIN